MTELTPNQRDQIVAAARSWIGTPYHHQQSVKGVGCDCLGLVRGVWRDLAGNEPAVVPAYGPSWAEGGEDKMLNAFGDYLDAAQYVMPGTVLAFRYRRNLPARHVAIATSSLTMIHAYDKRPAGEVQITGFWRRRLAARFDFPSEVF